MLRMISITALFGLSLGLLASATRPHLTTTAIADTISDQTSPSDAASSISTRQGVPVFKDEMDGFYEMSSDSDSQP
jgi:hypothetical protein